MSVSCQGRLWPCRMIQLRAKLLQPSHSVFWWYRRAAAQTVQYVLDLAHIVYVAPRPGPVCTGMFQCIKLKRLITLVQVASIASLKRRDYEFRMTFTTSRRKVMAVNLITSNCSCNAPVKSLKWTFLRCKITMKCSKTQDLLSVFVMDHHVGGPALFAAAVAQVVKSVGHWFILNV